MTRSLRLLDCTLRDGGYLNDWSFGRNTLTCIFDRLNEAGIDIIEVGFLDDKYQYDMNRTIQPDTQSMGRAFSRTVEKKSMIVAMIDVGNCCLSNIQPQKESILDGIRLIFKKEKMEDALEFGRKLVELEYAVFLQLVSITDYEEEDIKHLATEANLIGVDTVSLVDTYGLMEREDVMKYFKWLNEYLDKNIATGYHSHNNFQLAYSNTALILDLAPIDRDIVLDGTLYGMGKSAGNAPLELLANNLNQRFGRKYDINQLLEAINSEILPLYERYRWGYNLFYYISAENDCHPSYVSYLTDKKTLSMKDVNSILAMIEPSHRLRYDKDYIETLYGEYILKNIDDGVCISSLKGLMKDKEILLIGPGKSSVTESERIANYAQQNSPVVISVNFIPTSIEPDYVFISNPMRYSLILPDILGKKTKVIGTSNVTPAGRPFDYTVRYDSLITPGAIWDNSLSIFLNLVNKIGVISLTLAGFDGFTNNPEDNYVDAYFDFSKDYEYLSSVNKSMSLMISDYRKEMNITFLTKSLYNGENDI